MRMIIDDVTPMLRRSTAGMPSRCPGTTGRAIVALFVTFAVAGCGARIPHGQKPRSDVVLTITDDGEPVPQGYVSLVNDATGEGGGGALDATGRALLSGVVLGDYVVTVGPPETVVSPASDGRPGGAGERQAAVPDRFHRAATSPLRVSVGPDRNEFTFDLKQASPKQAR